MGGAADAEKFGAFAEGGKIPDKSASSSEMQVNQAAIKMDGVVSLEQIKV